MSETNEEWKALRLLDPVNQVPIAKAIMNSANLLWDNDTDMEKTDSAIVSIYELIKVLGNQRYLF
jgi:hypothetical protein